ncbi:MAG TPA: hypothetical protein VE422_14450 [Terriglobia bacterium]|nr:hypothetical protein [Terriglobia bacterium]
MQRWMNGEAIAGPVTVVVPALYNYLPGEGIAMGWLNEIDALVTIRQRMMCAAKISGWDVFTFHTLHNLDHYFDSTIATVRETWVKEGNLSMAAAYETKRRFRKPYDYHRVQPRLVENLVFQSSLIDWISHRAIDVPLRFHIIGTSLLSALVSTGAITFDDAVKSALKIGARWDETLRERAEGRTDDEIGWSRFLQVGRIIGGGSDLSLAVQHEDLPAVATPSRPFWYSPAASKPPVLIQTAQDAAAALETMNLASWSSELPSGASESVRGWLVTPLHPMAHACKWSVSNYLLATPAASALFLDHIATLGRPPVVYAEPTIVQNRFRLSRMKVTGP